MGGVSRFSMHGRQAKGWHDRADERGVANRRLHSVIVHKAVSALVTTSNRYSVTLTTTHGYKYNVTVRWE